jgi:type VI secretion system protein VasI
MGDSLMGRGILLPAVLVLAGAPLPVAAGAIEDALSDCAAIAGSFERLDCYDALARGHGTDQAEVAPAPAGKWKVEQRDSGISGAVDVYMVVQAVEKIQGEDGQVRPVLVVRCENNSTAVIFNFARFIEQSRAEIALRIDDGEVVAASLKMSASGKAFGFWRGDRAIPFVKRLLGGKRLLVEVTPFGARPVLAEFPVEGLDKAVAPLRKACGW